MKTEHDEHRAIRRAAHEWQILLATSDVSAHQQSAFKQWLHSDPRHEDAYARAAALSSALDELSRDDLDIDVYSTIQDNIPSALFKAWRGLRNSRPIQAAAATVAVAAITLIVLPHVLKPTASPVEQASIPPVAFETKIGEVREFELADSSKVVLGAATEIVFSTTNRSRNVELIRGAAFFDVAPDPDKPFKVIAHDLTATVLGTQFDVRLSGDTTRVSVAEGRVEVRHPMRIEGEPLNFETRRLVKSGFQIAATDRSGLQSTTTLDAARIAEWRDGRLVYESATLSEFVADANRYTDASISFAPGSEFASRLKISGAFNATDITGMLAALETIHPLKIVRIKPDVIQIRLTDE